MVPSLRQVPQSPAGDMAHLEIPDLGVEDVLELQLQQLTLAQFTVTVMEHVIPFLKTGFPSFVLFACALSNNNCLLLS